jgi:hypothetical protein
MADNDAVPSILNLSPREIQQAVTELGVILPGTDRWDRRPLYGDPPGNPGEACEIRKGPIVRAAS